MQAASCLKGAAAAAPFLRPSAPRPRRIPANLALPFARPSPRRGVGTMATVDAATAPAPPGPIVQYVVLRRDLG
jgi:hypothetical protein